MELGLQIGKKTGEKNELNENIINIKRMQTLCEKILRVVGCFVSVNKLLLAFRS